MADYNNLREEIKTLTERLETGIQDLFSSEKYRAYLDTMSNFHNYSFRNTVLIHLQRPGATQVAGFQKWKRELKRHVMKDEKGIRIFAPSPYVMKKEMEKLDPDTGVPLLDNNGKPVVEEVDITIPAFRPVSVFDVSQTDGKPLPSLAEDLTGDVQQYDAFMDALKAVSVMPIGFEALDPDTDGECRFNSREIAIREGMSEVQTVSAAIHEMAHAELHDYNVELDRQEQEAEAEDLPEQDGEESAPKPRKRRAEEVEAESVSYVVCQHYGIETSANSFGYIAEWSKGKELTELKESLELIRRSAASMIERIDGKFAEICKERGIDLTPEQTAPEQPTRFVAVHEDGKSFVRDTAKDIFHAENGIVIQYTDEAAAIEAADKLNREALQGLEQEVRATVQWFIDEDMKNHGELRPMTLEIIAKQGYEYRDGKLELAAPIEPPAPKHQRNDEHSKYADVLRNYNEITGYTTSVEEFLQDVSDGIIANQLLNSPYVISDTPRYEHKEDSPHYQRVTDLISDIRNIYHSDIIQPEKPAPEKSEPEANAKPKRKYYITPRQQEQAERMAEKWEARGEAFYTGGDGWGLDTADYCKTPEEADGAKNHAEKIRDAINILLSGNGTWDDVQVIRDAVSSRDELDAQIAVMKDEKNHDTPENKYKLGFGPDENGVSVWNWHEPNDGNGNAKYLAHISHDREITYVSQNLPDSLKSDIEKIAQGNWEKMFEIEKQMGSSYTDVTDNQPAKSSKQYDIGYGHLGNGLTFWNKLEEKNGDYITVAHIDAERNVKFLDPFLPESIKTWIADLSFSNDHTVSATQDAPVFITPSEYDIKELDPIDQFAKDYYQCSLDTYRNGKPRDNPKTVNQDIAGIAQTVRDGSYDALRENIARMAHNSKAPEQPLALMKRLDQIQAAGQDADVVLPDPGIGFSERDLYGYTDTTMLPLLAYKAMQLFELDHTIYMLHPDNTESMLFNAEEIATHDGIFGIESEEWQASLEYEAMKEQVENSEATKQAMLIFGKNDTYGIYQIKGGEEMRDYIFEAHSRLQDKGLSVNRGNYELVYTAPLNEGETLDSIYEKFNINHPFDYQGRSLSMSDVIVLQQGGEITSHYVDSFEFKELSSFLGYEKKPELATDVSMPPASTGPTVAELEAQVKAGQQISLTDLANAVKNERSGPATSKGKIKRNVRSKSDKPSILAKLQEAQSEAEKGKEQEKTAPKRNNEQEV